MYEAAFAVLMTINLPFLSTDHKSLNAQQEECFAASMIGYDYVINSRAGLPIERALNTLSVDKTSKIVHNTYKLLFKSSCCKCLSLASFTTHIRG